MNSSPSTSISILSASTRNTSPIQLVEPSAADNVPVRISVAEPLSSRSTFIVEVVGKVTLYPSPPLTAVAM